MHYLPPFALFSSRTALDEGRVAQHVEQWCGVLEQLQGGTLRPEAADPFDKLQHYLAETGAGL